MSRALLAIIVGLGILSSVWAVDARAQSPVLIVSEIDYDQPGSDTAEWIELLNTQDYEYQLYDYALVLYDADENGSCSEYCRVDLSPVFLIENHAVVVGNHPCAVLPLCSTTDAIQNGSPDVIAIEYLGQVIHAVEFGSGLVHSVCPGIPAISRTNTVDSDTEDGTMRTCSGHGLYWRFAAAPTPCAPNDCPMTDAPPPGERPSWGCVKNIYRD